MPFYNADGSPQIEPKGTVVGDAVEEYLELIEAARFKKAAADKELKNLEHLLILCLVNSDYAEFVQLDYAELQRQFL